jgi:glutathione peroxidase-family protein
MNGKVNTYATILILLNVIIFLYFKIPHYKNIVKCDDESPSVKEILQYGDRISDTSIVDRYGNTFNINNYKEMPLLIFFVGSNSDYIKSMNDSLQNRFKYYYDKGLMNIYISKEKTSNNSIIKNAIIYYDTDSMIFAKIFHTDKVRMANILISRKRVVLLSTAVSVTYDELENILNEKEKILYE